MSDWLGLNEIQAEFVRSKVCDSKISLDLEPILRSRDRIDMAIVYSPISINSRPNFRLSWKPNK